MTVGITTLNVGRGVVSVAGRWGSLVSFGLRVAVTTIQIRAGPLFAGHAPTSDIEEALPRKREPNEYE